MIDRDSLRAIVAIRGRYSVQRRERVRSTFI